MKETTWPLPSTVTGDSWCRWRGTSPRFTGGHKGIFHKHWHTHQLPGCLSRQGPLWSPACVVSVPSLVRGSHGCSLHLLCQCDLSVSSGSAQTHTRCRDPGSAYTQGVRLRLMQALRHRCIYLVIYLCLQFSALTHLTALTLALGTCVCTLVYMCNACKLFQICAHTDMNTNIF